MSFDRSACKALFWAFLTCGLVGCHSVPLGDPEKSVANPAYTGWFENEQNVYHVAQYDSRTYLIDGYGYKEEGTAITPKSHFLAKAWITPIAGNDILTAEAIGPDWELQPADKVPVRYVYIRLKKVGPDIEGTALNVDFLKETKTPAELEKKVTDNINNPELWKGQTPGTLKHIGDDRIEWLKKVVKAFAPPEGP